MIKSASAPVSNREASGGLPPHSRVQELATQVERLVVLYGVLETPAGRLAREVLAQRGDEATAAEAYVRLFRLLAEEAAEREQAAPGDAWQQHLAVRLLSAENILARAVRRHGWEHVPEGLRLAARQDLRVLGTLYQDGGELLRTLAAAGGVTELPSLAGLQAGDLPPAHDAALLDHLQQAPDWGELLPHLARHYAAAGTGFFAGYQAFRWLGADHQPPLHGVRRPDPVRLSDLIGDQHQRELIVRNTEHFLAGLPANNVLLYGDRGTGKSSTVKALLNEYGERGLRLLEVARSQLGDFPSIVELLAEQPERFILFVDDLSFDEQETAYKDLKAVLEGGVEVRPANVLVYATSNRRHLVKERQSDRAQPGDDELHGFDTVQEKLSLADRFGITLTFVTPNQEQFLEIVRGLAERRELSLPEEELRRRALQWASWHNGRSGRSARQFVDHLTGELAAEA